MAISPQASPFWAFLFLDSNHTLLPDTGFPTSNPLLSLQSLVTNVVLWFDQKSTSTARKLRKKKMYSSFVSTVLSYSTFSCNTIRNIYLCLYVCVLFRPDWAKKLWVNGNIMIFVDIAVPDTWWWHSYSKGLCISSFKMLMHVKCSDISRMNTEFWNSYVCVQMGINLGVRNMSGERIIWINLISHTIIECKISHH